MTTPRILLRVEVPYGATRAVFDGHCAICSRFALDLKEEMGDRIFLVSCADPERARFVPEVTDEMCAKSFVVVPPGGVPLAGIDAILSLRTVSPSVRRWAWLAYLPGGYGTARVAYEWFSRNRRRLCKGCETT